MHNLDSIPKVYFLSVKFDGIEFGELSQENFNSIMENDSLMLWKLKYGKAFLNSFLKCGHMVFEGKKCIQAKSIKLFIGLGLVHEIPQINRSSKENQEIKLGFTKQGISIYDQLLKQINRGIIYKEHSGQINWKNFQFV